MASTWFSPLKFVPVTQSLHVRSPAVLTLPYGKSLWKGHMDIQETQSVPALCVLSLPSSGTRHASMEVVEMIPRILPDCYHMRIAKEYH